MTEQIFSQDFFDAIARNDVTALQSFFAADPSLKEKMNSSEGMSALNRALRNKALDAFKELSKHCTSTTQLMEVNGNTLLHWYVFTAESGDHLDSLELLRQLLEFGADPNCLDIHGATPLHDAYELRRLKSIALLIKHGASETISDCDGLRPPQRKLLSALLDACADGDVATAENLLTEEPSLAQATNRIYSSDSIYLRRTALMVAARSGHVPIIKLLLKTPGVRVDLATEEGQTALHIAATYGQSDAALQLIEAGANIHQIDEDGCTPLHSAMEGNKRKIVAALLKAGANPNAYSPSHGTPLGTLLMWKKNCKQNAELLLAAGSDPSIRNKDNRSPLDFAKEFDRGADVVALIEQKILPTIPSENVDDPPEIKRAPNESDFDFYKRKWHADKSSDALSGFYNFVFQNDESLHYCEKVIAYLGPPNDMDDGWINYEAEDDTYVVSFEHDTETGKITAWNET